MRTRTGRRTALAVAAAGMLLGVGTAFAVNIEIEGATIPPQGSGEVQVSVDPETAGVVATLNDIQFPAGREVFVTQRTITATLATAIDADDDMITVDNADEFPSFGIVTIEGEEISYSEINDNTLVVAARGATPADHAVGVPVTVPSSVPDCAATSEIINLNKEVVFSFLPDGCDPEADCLGVRAIVIALDNLDSFNVQTSIYRCSVSTNQDTGTFPLACPEVGGACTTDDDCEGEETCNTTSGTCVPPAPFQPAQSGDSPLDENQVGNLPTTCTGGDVNVSDEPSCVGDCGEPLGVVSLGEVQRAFRGFLTQDRNLCPAADIDNDGISLGNVQQSFRNFLAGACPEG